MTAIVPRRRPAAPAVPVPAVDPSDPAGRAVAVRVNLLPAEILEARKGHKIRRVAVGVLAALAIVLGAAIFVVRGDVGAARADLAAADRLSASLRAQQGKYADVVALQDQVRDAVGRLDALTGRDFDWAPLLTSVALALPTGVKIADLTAATEDSAAAGSVGGAPGGGGAPAAGATPSTAPTAATATTPPAADAASTGPTPVGVITISGNAPDPNAVAAYVDALSRITGLDSVVATDVSAVGDATTGAITGYTYGITAVLTSAGALHAPTPTGGK